MASTSSPNTLGLDFDQLNIKDSSLPEEPPVSTSPQPPQPTSQEDQSSAPAATETKDKKKPYINPERVKTGGNQRVSIILAHKSATVTYNTLRTS